MPGTWRLQLHLSNHHFELTGTTLPAHLGASTPSTFYKHTQSHTPLSCVFTVEASTLVWLVPGLHSGGCCHSIIISKTGGRGTVTIAALQCSLFRYSSLIPCIPSLSTTDSSEFSCSQSSSFVSYLLLSDTVLHIHNHKGRSG